MLLTFKKHYDDGSATHFETDIKSGLKKHTIREDAHNRWKAGNKIHFWSGNPRNTHLNPFPFNVEGCDTCISTQEIFIHPDFGPSGGIYSFVVVDNRQLSPDEVLVLALNDGFASARQFYKYFGKDFTGKIIHWTDLKY